VCPPRTQPVGLGNRYIELEPGGPRARSAITGAPPRITGQVPGATGHTVTLVGGGVPARVHLQELCFPRTVRIGGDPVPVTVTRHSRSFTAGPSGSITTAGMSCPTGSVPLSAGYSLDPRRALLVAPAFGDRPPAILRILSAERAGAVVRFHVLCLQGRLLFTRGRRTQQVTTVVGPITISSR
jgi:hypothetical protein